MERPAAKARPTPKASEPVQILEGTAAKARPTSKASGPVDYPTGSSSSSVVPEAKSSGTNQLGARAKPAAKAIERILRPRLYLPDTVVWFDRGNKAEDIGSGPEPVGVNFRGYKLQFISWLQNIRQSKISGISKIHSFPWLAPSVGSIENGRNLERYISAGFHCVFATPENRQHSRRGVIESFSYRTFKQKSGQPTSNLQSIQTDCGRRTHHIDFRDPGTLWSCWEGSYNQKLYSQLSDSLRLG